MPNEVQLEFSVVPGHPKSLTQPVIGIGKFEAGHSSAVVYTENALSRLWVDLIMGRSLPTKLVIRKIETLEHLVCLALFMDREVALHPKIPSLVSSVELVEHLSVPGLAHIEPDLSRLFVFLEGYLLTKEPNPKELSRKLQQALLWIREFVLDGKLPNMPRSSDPPRIIDHGTNGFIVAETKGPFLEAIVEVYRQGFLRGVMFGPEVEGHRAVACFRKSHYLNYDLGEAERRLSQLEKGPSLWKFQGLTLFNSSSSVPRDVIVDVLIRV